MHPRMGDLIDNNEQDEFDELNIQIDRFDRFFTGLDPFDGDARMNCYKLVIRLYEIPKLKGVGLAFKGLPTLVWHDEAINYPGRRWVV